MRLSSENGEPHVERGDKRHGSEQGLHTSRLGAEKRLKGKQRRSGHSEREPDVEVEQQVPDVEGPRLNPEDIGTSALSAKNVVRNDIPGYNNKFTQESVVYSNFKSLGELAQAQDGEAMQEVIPELQNTSSRHPERLGTSLSCLTTTSR